jgi:hypothetical protein
MRPGAYPEMTMSMGLVVLGTTTPTFEDAEDKALAREREMWLVKTTKVSQEHGNCDQGF